MTDDELRELTRVARAKVAAAMATRSVSDAQAYIAETQMPRPEGLQAHALPANAATWEPPCMTCHDPIGYTAPAGKYVGATECAKCRAGSVERRLANSGISEREYGQRLDDLKMHGPDSRGYTDYVRWIAFLRAFAALTPGAKLDPPFAFACGHRGVGKSAGAQRALYAAIVNGCQGVYVRVTDLLRDVYATYGAEPDDRTIDRFRFFADVHLLVIDQIGQDVMSEHAQSVFFDIVDDRWRKLKPTILLSNFTPEESIRTKSADAQDPTMLAMVDRMRGGARANLFVICGKSWRGSEVAR